MTAADRPPPQVVSHLVADMSTPFVSLLLTKLQARGRRVGRGPQRRPFPTTREAPRTLSG